MAWRAALLMMTVMMAGCIAPSGLFSDEPLRCEGEVQDVGREGGRFLEVQVANTQPEPACIRVYLDGMLVAVREFPGEHPGLHANPGQVVQVRWPASTVTLEVAADGGARGVERFQLSEETWLAAWVGKDVAMRSFEREPMWM